MFIVDNQTESDTDNDEGMHNHDGVGNANFLIKDHHTTEGIEDTLNSELVNRLEYQDSGLRHRELSSALSTPSTGSLAVAMEQQVNGDTLPENHVTIHEPQGPLNKEAEEHSKRTLLQSCLN